MSQPKIVVVGGGFSGLTAAVAAAKVGARVTLLERMDLLSGAGLRAGRMSYNGKLVGDEEAKALGGGEVFEALESILLHRANIVDEEFGYVYDTAKVDMAMRRLTGAKGIEVQMESRAVNVKKKANAVTAVVLDSGESIEGDVFIDATGTYGGVDVCTQFGNGCAMCLYRCITFGDRISVATRAGAPELMRRRPDGTPGASGAAVMVHKASLDRDLRARLEKQGSVTIPLPERLIDHSKLQKIGGVRSLRQMENLNLVDIGLSAKCVGVGTLSLTDIRTLPGLECAILEHPIGGGRAYGVSKVSMAPREPWLQVKGLDNLFVAGEKAGPGTGIVEVMTIGIMAGNNAVRKAAGKASLVLPRTTAIGDFIQFTGEMMSAPGGLSKGYSYAHDTYFQRMKELGFYTGDVSVIHQRIEKLGLTGILSERLVA